MDSTRAYSYRDRPIPVGMTSFTYDIAEIANIREGIPRKSWVVKYEDNHVQITTSAPLSSS